jgi:uncharacterized protein
VPTQTRNRTIRPLLLVALLTLAGCFSLSRDVPPQQHYVLGAGGPSALAVPAAQRGEPGLDAHLIGLRSPRLADYLGTPFIVVRRGLHQIEFSEYHRWGEDLGRAINRTVVGHLAGPMAHHRVEAAPWPAGASPDHLIQLHILRFEGLVPQGSPWGEGTAHLLANWEILRPLDGAVLARGTTEVTEGNWAVGDFDGLVRLLDAGLAVLAEDLVLALEQALTP